MTRVPSCADQVTQCCPLGKYCREWLARGNRPRLRPTPWLSQPWAPDAMGVTTTGLRRLESGAGRGRGSARVLSGAAPRYTGFTSAGYFAGRVRAGYVPAHAARAGDEDVYDLVRGDDAPHSWVAMMSGAG
jgi:hypothetical protein